MSVEELGKKRVLTVTAPRQHRGTFIGTSTGTADLKTKYRTTRTAVYFESTASKPASPYTTELVDLTEISGHSRIGIPNQTCI